MKHTIKKACLSLFCVAAITITSCKKDIDDIGILNSGNGYYTENGVALKDAAGIPIGVAINYGPWTTEPLFGEIAKRDFDQAVFGYEMKHGAVVQNNGTYNFTQADALVAAAGSMDIFGHTLCWHQNQNATYLKNFSGITVPAPSELLSNPGFESGLTNWNIYNTGNPSGTSTLTATNVAAEVRTGTGAFKVNNPVAYPGSQWRVQAASDIVTVVPGKQYILSYWVKAQSANGSIRMSTLYGDGGTSQYQGDQTIGTSWQQITWNISASSAQLRLVFDLGQAANIYYIDDASIKEVIVPPTGPAVAAQLDLALNNFITTMVNRYKNKVKAWDVYNEPFSDNPVQLRNNTNTSTTPADVLVWSNYLGRDAALKAFNYAKAADPTADLYINDYNLESNPAKLDSLIAFVAELKAKGAKIDGIGTQMHINATATGFTSGVDNMMKKLAATGLKIRISELDIRTSTLGKSYKAVEVDQPAMYKYIVNSYLRYIPKAQQAGITVWGINDKNSWLYDGGKELPLLYDNNYNKKPAYAAVLQALQGK